MPAFKASGVIGSYGELGKVYTVNPSVNDGVKEFKAYVVRPTLTRFHRLSNLSAIVTNHPGPAQFAGAGPAPQFDPSTIVDAAMTRVVEHQHAEPVPDEQQVFNVQTDPLFQIAEAHHLLPETVSETEVGTVDRVKQLALELATNPKNRLLFAEGVVKGFAVDGIGGTIEFVANDVPALASKASSWAGRQWEIFKWDVWAITHHPVWSAQSLGNDILETARSARDFTVKTSLHGGNGSKSSINVSNDSPVDLDFH